MNQCHTPALFHLQSAPVDIQTHTEWVCPSGKDFCISLGLCCLLMPMVGSFSHQAGSPLAWSLGSEGNQEEKVGSADHTEVRQREKRASRLRSTGVSLAEFLWFKKKKVCVCLSVLWARRRHWIPWGWSYSVWVSQCRSYNLNTGPHDWAASTLNHKVIFPAPVFMILFYVCKRFACMYLSV